MEFGVALPALLQGCRWTLWHERFSAEQPHRRSKWNKTGITRWSDLKRLQSLEKALKEIDINVWNLGMSWDGASGDNPVRRTEGYLQGRQPWKNPEHHLLTVKISNNYIYKSNRTSSHSNIYQVSRGISLPGIKQFDFFVFPEHCLVLILPELLDHPGFEARDRRGFTFASQWCKQLRTLAKSWLMILVGLQAQIRPVLAPIWCHATEKQCFLQLCLCSGLICYWKLCLKSRSYFIHHVLAILALLKPRAGFIETEIPLLLQWISHPWGSRKSRLSWASQ